MWFSSAPGSSRRAQSQQLLRDAEVRFHPCLVHHGLLVGWVPVRTGAYDPALRLEAGELCGVDDAVGVVVIVGHRQGEVDVEARHPEAGRIRFPVEVRDGLLDGLLEACAGLQDLAVLSQAGMGQGRVLVVQDRELVQELQAPGDLRVPD